MCICLSSVWSRISDSLFAFLFVVLLLTDEDHFNANVQNRRTARHDVGVAQKLQEQEVEVFRKEEAERKQQMKQK